MNLRWKGAVKRAVQLIFSGVCVLEVKINEQDCSKKKIKNDPHRSVNDKFEEIKQLFTTRGGVNAQILIQELGHVRSIEFVAQLSVIMTRAHPRNHGQFEAAVLFACNALGLFHQQRAVALVLE
jgi:hypothetical protein